MGATKKGASRKGSTANGNGNGVDENKESKRSSAVTSSSLSSSSATSVASSLTQTNTSSSSSAKAKKPKKKKAATTSSITSSIASDDSDNDDDNDDDDVDLDQLATTVARKLASSVLAGLPAPLQSSPTNDTPRYRITKAEKGDDADSRGKFVKVGGIVRLRTDVEGGNEDGHNHTPDLLASIGKKQQLPSLNPNERKRAAEKKKPDTAGAGWFDLPATPMTAETAASLKVIGLRQYLDPKRFYKKDKGRKTPKYFQIGTVIGGAGDSKLGKLTRKERAPNMMKEILADTDTRGYLKRKFTEVQAARGTGAQKHKRFKKKGPGGKRK